MCSSQNNSVLAPYLRTLRVCLLFLLGVLTTSGCRETEIAFTLQSSDDLDKMQAYLLRDNGQSVNVQRLGNTEGNNEVAGWFSKTQIFILEEIRSGVYQFSLCDTASMKCIPVLPNGKPKQNRPNTGDHAALGNRFYFIAANTELQYCDFTLLPIPGCGEVHSAAPRNSVLPRIDSFSINSAGTLIAYAQADASTGCLKEYIARVSDLDDNGNRTYIDNCDVRSDPKQNFFGVWHPTESVLSYQYHVGNSINDPRYNISFALADLPQLLQAAPSTKAFNTNITIFQVDHLSEPVAWHPSSKALYVTACLKNGKYDDAGNCSQNSSTGKYDSAIVRLEPDARFSSWTEALQAWQQSNSATDEGFIAEPTPVTNPQSIINPRFPSLPNANYLVFAADLPCSTADLPCSNRTGIYIADAHGSTIPRLLYEAPERFKPVHLQANPF